MEYITQYVDGAILSKLNERQVRVILSGFGGDGAASRSDFRVLSTVARQFRFKKLFLMIREKRQAQNKSIWQIIRHDLAPDFTPAMVKQIYRKWNEKTRPLPRFQAHFPYLTATKLKQYSNIRVDEIKNIEELIAEEFHTIGFDLFNLRQAAFPSETVLPLMDKRILDFIINVPPEQLTPKGWSRGLLRFAMDGILPPEIQWRPSKGLLSMDLSARIIKQKEQFKAFFIENQETLKKYVIIDKAVSAFDNLRVFNTKDSADFSYNAHGLYRLVIHLKLYLLVLNKKKNKSLFKNKEF